jgi:hypothetical protein
LVANQEVGGNKELTVFYGGKPKVAVNPPWDGELLGKKIQTENHLLLPLAGLGASVWPNKDHMYDE